MTISQATLMRMPHLAGPMLRLGGYWVERSAHWVMQNNRKGARKVRRMLRRAGR